MSAFGKFKENSRRGIVKVSMQQDFGRTLALSTFAVLLVQILIQHGSNIYALVEFDALTLATRIRLVNSLILDTFTVSFSHTAYILMVCILVASNFVLLRALVLSASNTSRRAIGIGSSGVFVAMTILGCTACGGAVFFLLSGSVATGTALLLQGNILQVISLSLLAIANILFLQRLGYPQTCEIAEQAKEGK